MEKDAPAYDPLAWHVLADTSVPVSEFALALSKVATVTCWRPEMSFAGVFQRGTRVQEDGAGPRVVSFPLQRGFARLPHALGALAIADVLPMLMQQTENAGRTVLICTSSFWCEIARRWPGPVVYYVTDLTTEYSGLSASRVRADDRRMCRAANVVCPNSERIAAYLRREASCDPAKIVIVPNATRGANLRDADYAVCDPLPLDAAHLPRPVAGVIGNMGLNVDWELVLEAMREAPEYHWLFVGPTTEELRSHRAQQARIEVMRSPRALFLGSRPYADLYRYARALDVAVLPYARIEPTYSGSSTRFYEHLAAGRPMIATRGVEELLRKEPLLTLVDSAYDLAAELRKLMPRPADGLEAIRCVASRSETWEARAAAVQEALHQRLQSGHRSDLA